MTSKRTKWKARKRAFEAKAQKAAHVAALRAREERAALPIQPSDCLPPHLVALGERAGVVHMTFPTGCRDSSREQLVAAYRAGAAIDKMRAATEEAMRALVDILEA